MTADSIPIGVAGNSFPAGLSLAMANRHGLIAGATGTGKTVSLQVLAEGFSKAGVPVFLSDIKGDLSGLASPATASEKILARAVKTGVTAYAPQAFPVVLWDLFGTRGHPVRTTVSDMGPLLLSHVMELSDTQSDVLHAAFKIADDHGLLLLDLKDLRALIGWLSEQRAELEKQYGRMASASLASIQRDLLVLEQAGAARFFGEPVLAIDDLMRVDFAGNGVISVFDATALSTHPKLYTTFLLWLLAELFEQLPEVGDLQRPKLVFFFEEAHLLFNAAPKPLLEKIEQVVRLIRSKGVGVYFITQNPMDVPEAVLCQLGNRIQHALRSFTPKDQKAVKAAAHTFRTNRAIDTAEVITQLGVGEALVSMLDGKGIPAPVERVMIRPPSSRMGPLTDAQREELLRRSPYHGRYETPVDRASAYETLLERGENVDKKNATSAARKAPQQSRQRHRQHRPAGRGETAFEAFTNSALRSVGSQLGRQLVRGLLGSLLGGKR